MYGMAEFLYLTIHYTITVFSVLCLHPSNVQCYGELSWPGRGHYLDTLYFLPQQARYKTGMELWNITDSIHTNTDLSGQAKDQANLKPVSA